MTVELRVLESGQWDDWYGELERAFGGVRESAEERALWRDLTEYERSLAAWDGEELVGTTGAFSFRLSVPGGSLVPTAGVTCVGVRSTHRRRGVLTAMMRRQLDDVRGWGEPLAVLGASEPPIYGRFGYGLATERLRMEIDSVRVRLAAVSGADEVRLRLVPPGAGSAACEAVYARRVAGRPGMLARQPGWERLPLLDPPSERRGAGEQQCVLAERDGEVIGYARFCVKPDWDEAGPKGSVLVRDVEALDPAGYAALWRYLFGVDLTSTVTASNRPADDPVLHLVSDIRRCRVRVRDGMFLRLVDVGRALAARTYAAPVDVVFAVEDAFCPWNEGSWRLSGDQKGAVCERTTDAPDLSLSVRELASAYLGGFSLTALAAAGRVRELRPGALTEAASAFGHEVAPWLPHGF
ncbi:GNAT family N-acetyltransferase [Streptantibioticus rubrisoli]|uniref:GNAT family N-acetyltransferase n=1 Tax=Streptantibioticus rubrisoli TaxID=1387313 RepID=A0ABT1PPM2_9ACTN|nr:GNAT family N-acetyltransferase [Streptantibioticus rubrisoli]MCQ4046168.1 GNAT family N-acetyltransferase [Streptantibioticus rubrisoli]